MLLVLCSAKPSSRPSYMMLKNMMLKDTEDEMDGDPDDDNSLFPTREPINPFFPFDLFPTCPFGCQCYSRVVHCSDLGKNISQLVLEKIPLTKLKGQEESSLKFQKSANCKAIFHLSFLKIQQTQSTSKLILKIQNTKGSSGNFIYRTSFPSQI